MATAAFSQAAAEEKIPDRRSILARTCQPLAPPLPTSSKSATGDGIDADALPQVMRKNMTQVIDETLERHPKVGGLMKTGFCACTFVIASTAGEEGG